MRDDVTNVTSSLIGWAHIQNDSCISTVSVDASKACNITLSFDPSISIFRLIHWGRVTHICVVDLTVVGSDNGLLPGQRQAIIWTNAGILLIGPLGTNFSEILIEIQTFSLKKISLKMSSAKCCAVRVPFYGVCFDQDSINVDPGTSTFSHNFRSPPLIYHGSDTWGMVQWDLAHVARRVHVSESRGGALPWTL